VRRRDAVAGALAALGGVSCTSLARRVQPGMNLAQAVREARDGDVIEIGPGRHEGQTALITQQRLTLRGVGERPVLEAAGAHTEGKAILVVRGGDIVIENLELRGARVPSGNGAGIRLEGGRLRVERCAFLDNEMGLLSANRPEIELSLRDCEFAQAPRHPGLLHHLLYVGRIGRFEIIGCRLHGGWRGHLIKSRARENRILANHVVDDDDGEASYELDLPNGGLAWVVGNVFGQSAGTQNPTIVSFGAEGDAHADSALTLANNTLINRCAAPEATFVKVWRERLPAGVELRFTDNRLLGPGAFDDGNAIESRGNVRAALPAPGRDPAR